MYPSKRFITLLTYLFLSCVIVLSAHAQTPDSDSDGVPDGQDVCPTAKANTQRPNTDPYYGCPDSDIDGVVDLIDPCPTQTGMTGGNGCPLKENDRDGDGAPDDKDKCPDTPSRGILLPDNAYYGCVDTDFDQVADQADVCPQQEGVPQNAGCPLTGDRDGDGVKDGDDLCVTVSGPADNKGCPLTNDRDGDGITDGNDQCREQQGTAANKGCPATPAPADRDGDSIVDAQDRCPDQFGVITNSGCPATTPTITTGTRATLPASSATCLVLPNIANRVVNVRLTPGETAPFIGTIPDTQTYRAIAQGTEADGRVWYQLESQGWVADRVLDKVGPCAQLPATANNTASTATPTPIPTATSSIRSAPQAVPASAQVIIPTTRQIMTAENSAQTRLLASQTNIQTSQILVAHNSSVLLYEGAQEAQIYNVGASQTTLLPLTVTSPTFLALTNDASRYALSYLAPEGTVLAINYTTGTTQPALWLLNANQAMFSPDGTLLLTYFYNGTVAANGKTILNFLSSDGSGNDRAVEYEGMVTRAVFNADGTRLAFVIVDSTGQNYVNIIDPLNPTALIQTLPTGNSHANQYGTAGLAFSPGGATLALGTIDGKVLLWDTATWTLRSTLEVLPQSLISSLSFDPSGTLLAIGGGLPPIPPATLPSGVVVLVLDANTGALLASLSGHVGMVNQLAFSSDSTLLVSGSNQGEIKWWGVAQ